MRTIYQYVRPRLPRMGLIFSIKTFGTIIELFLPWLLSSIIDDCAAVGDVRGAWLRGGLMLLCALAALFGNACANRMSCAVSRDVTKQLRYDLFEKTLHLSCAQVDRFTVPSLMSRVNSDVYNVHTMLDRMQRLGVRAPMLLLGGSLVALTLEPVLALVLIATLPLLGVVLVYVSRHGVPLFEASQQSLDRLVRKVQENMTGARVIKALSKMDWEREKFDEASKENVRRESKASSVMALTGPVMNLLLNVGLAAVIWVGAVRVQSGLTQPGKIIAFLSYFTIILNALLMISRIFTYYSKGLASARRVAEVLNAPVELEPQKLLAQTDDAVLRFRDVAFSYNKSHVDLGPLSFAVRPGKTLGIIGPTGSGKTTVLALLQRFYDPDAGEILLKGQPLKSLSREALRGSIGVVQQNDFLLADTIDENIRFGRNIEEAAIWDAAASAQAEFITRKEEGFQTKLTARGANLSGGQKQRVLITRALAGNPSILLLDDCSSALDYKTDAQLRHALKARKGVAATVIVAQRISAVRDCDQILVLDAGRQMGLGTHAELMQTCPMYRELYQLQLGEEATA